MLRQAFAKAGKINEGPGVLALDEAICRERPDLRGKPALFPSQGKCAYTMMFEHEVFKGPKNERLIRLIEQECNILRHLEGSGLKVPAVTTAGEEAVFFGMTRIQGVCLSRSRVEMMTFTEQRTAASEIAGFMIGLANAFTEEEAGVIITETRGSTPTPDKIISCFKGASVQSILAENLGDCCAYAEEYIGRLKGKKEVVLHQDLHGGNIMVDPDTNKITGFVDFGYVVKSVPEAGFIPLLWAFSSGFVKMVCEEYASLSEQKVEYRDVLLLNLLLGIKFLDDAVKNNREDEVVACKSRISTAFRELKDMDRALLSLPPPRLHYG